MKEWIKTGRIFCPENRGEMASHAYMPTPLVLADRFRVYFTSRNAENQSQIFFIDLDRADPSRVLHLHEQPILRAGKLGAFDDSGVQPNSVLEHDGRVYLYYMGFNPAKSVTTRNNTGLAVSDDGGLTFTRAFEGPVLDRTPEEPYFAFTPQVVIEDGKWHAWYASGTAYVVLNGNIEMLFETKYASSDDGVHWTRPNATCIPPRHPLEVNCQPAVVKIGGIYRMWFSVRSAKDFRTLDGDTYRIGYAESRDRLLWSRDDAKSGIDVSAEGWDSEMVCFCRVIEADGKLHMFYVGNGFGKEGFGHAYMNLDPKPRILDE